MRDDLHELETQQEVELFEPKRFKVILLNDDYSTMDFVVEILMSIFHKGLEEALSIMLAVHKSGRGVCGIYPYDIAETKSALVRKRAKESGFPLQVSLEEC